MRRKKAFRRESVPFDCPDTRFFFVVVVGFLIIETGIITFETQLVTAHLTQGLTCLEFGLVDFVSSSCFFDLWLLHSSLVPLPRR